MNMSSYTCCTSSKTQAKKLETLERVLKLVAEKSRLKLLCLLNKNTQCVCELMEQTKLSQSLISHHLKDLKEAGLLINQKKGLKVYYRLTAQGKKIINLLFKI